MPASPTEVLRDSALAESEQRYRSLVIATAQIVWITNPSGEVVDDMPMWREFTGQSWEEFQGWGWIDSVHPDDRPRTAEVWRQAVQTRSLYEIEYRLRRRDGEYRHVWVRGVPVFSTQGDLREWVGTCTDITERKRMEQVLEAERRRLHDVLDILPAYTILLKPDYHVPFTNRFFQERFGEPRGRRCFEFLFGRTGPCDDCESYKVLASGSPHRWEWTGPDGRSYDIYDHPFVDSDGSTVILEMGLDITDRSRAEAELRRLNRFLAALVRCTQAVVRAEAEAPLLQEVCDTMVQVGDFATAFVGLTTAADRRIVPVALSGDATDYVRQADIRWDDSERGQGPTGRAIRSGAPQVSDDLLEDASFRPWRSVAQDFGLRSSISLPLSIAGEVCGTINIYAREPRAFDADTRALLVEMASNLGHGIEALRTRAAREHAEQELRQAQQQLEDRVRERTAELEAANRELESFTYSVSHDLRAPLRHIDGFSRVLLERYGSRLDEDGRHYLDRVRQGTRQMAQLTDELLKLARLGRHALRRELVPLNGIVDEVLRELEPEAGERQMEWRVGPLPYVHCDPLLMRQVFFNLLANALKFTRRSEQALIEVGQRTEQGRTVVYVRDNGVGFDLKYADKLFGVFQRLHRQEDFEGTGIGLATVKRIVSKHGGEIWVDAQVERGATFYFTLDGARAALPDLREAA